MAAGDQGLRDLYFKEGIAYIPKILELADRNRLSRTYGCFDRSFWHYRTSDFPSGMYQEAVLPLALAYQLQHPENPYYQQARIKELALAGIHFAARSAHEDGSCDDYFPYERAAGAAAFSLYAATEAVLVLHENSEPFLAFFTKRADYLAREGFRESGILSNHKALMVLALYNVFLLTKEEKYRDLASQKKEDLLALQNPEGWFPEYEGCDPGYLSFTIDFLTKYYVKSGDESVLEPLLKAVDFSSYFMHPDGSYGGEYGSRNTFHFLPHACELLGRKSPWALYLANQFLRALQTQKRSFIDDDRIFIHYVYNYLQAYADFTSEREVEKKRFSENFVKKFDQAGLCIISTEKDYAVVSAVKGGVAKIFKNGILRYSDCGFVGRLKTGEKFISQVMGNGECSEDGETLTVSGRCYEHRDIVFTPFLFWCFRAFLIFLGRFLPANATRKFLQKKAILKKQRTVPISWRKTFPLRTLDQVTFEVRLDAPEIEIEELWIGADPTFIYIATSQPYQQGNLQPWLDFSSELRTLNTERRIQKTVRIS